MSFLRAHARRTRRSIADAAHRYFEAAGKNDPYGVGLYPLG